MKETEFIIQKARELCNAGEPAALATVARIGGSTYRRPGARMLIDRHGNHWGTISGGCLEGEVALRGEEVIASGQAVLVPFDLEEDDLVLGFGAGCNGVVHVLIEPLPATSLAGVIESLEWAANERRHAVMTTLIDAPADHPELLGRHALFSTGDPAPPLDPDLQEACQMDARALLEMETTAPRTVHWHSRRITLPQGDAECLFELIRPPVRLHIFGDGHDVPPIIDAGLLLGWEVVVIGRKPVDTLRERFPSATDHRFMMHPEDAAAMASTDDRSAALVMHHHFLRDQTALMRLLDAGLPYVGVLGPRERTADMMASVTLTPAMNERLFAPMGLDIGTESPEEIALSTISEIQAVLNQRSGGFLRDRSLPIHGERPHRATPGR